MPTKLEFDSATVVVHFSGDEPPERIERVQELRGYWGFTIPDQIDVVRLDETGKQIVASWMLKDIDRVELEGDEQRAVNLHDLFY